GLHDEACCVCEAAQWSVLSMCVCLCVHMCECVYVYVCVCVDVCIGARGLSCLHCLQCSLTARRSLVRFPHWALLALGGRSSPDLQCSVGLSPGPFCVEFACSPRVHKGFPPHRTPTQKHAKRSL